MGLVYVRMDVIHGRRAEEVEFLVDSGAIYSVLPSSTWRRLGLRPERKMDFVLADGEHVDRRVSQCVFAYEGLRVWSPVILGEKHDAALLGSVTLESLGLVLHPFERTLRPMRMILAAAR
jgi:predicted aspartyl protease